MFIFEGNEIETDSEGYLKDTTLWNEAMAAVIAEQEGISLSVEHWEVVRIGLPATLSRYVVEKGSITVDGVSLTVSAVGDDWFEVSLIPTTRELTTLGQAAVGTTVNLEVDIIAKYVERLMAGPGE